MPAPEPRPTGRASSSASAADTSSIIPSCVRCERTFGSLPFKLLSVGGALLSTRRALRVAGSVHRELLPPPNVAFLVLVVVVVCGASVSSQLLFSPLGAILLIYGSASTGCESLVFALRCK